MPRNKSRRQFPNKRKLAALALTAMVALTVVAIWVALNAAKQTNQTGFYEAAIIDQLSSSYPNDSFALTAGSMFHSNNWSTRYYVGSPVSDNVDFYRSLPLNSFKIIILRAHTAMDPNTKTLALFTSEVWSDSKATTTYLADILNNRLAIVRVTTGSTAYFGLTPNFVKAMNGDFQNATIIMMGCDGLTNTKMAEAFIEKGAKAYIGWNGFVTSDHTDAATQNLLKHLVAEKKSIGIAISEAMSEVGSDPTYGSTMSYYPTEAAQFKP